MTIIYNNNNNKNNFFCLLIFNNINNFLFLCKKKKRKTSSAETFSVAFLMQLVGTPSVNNTSNYIVLTVLKVIPKCMHFVVHIEKEKRESVRQH